MKNGRSAGIATVPRMNRVHTQGEASGRSHPATKVRNAAGADKVRRRLSRIFQRPMMGILTGFCFPGPDVAASEKPGQELPVSASPTVLACRNGFITRGKFFKQLNVCGQGYPGENAFKEVMA